MHYRVVYDITQEPAFSWPWAALSVGVIGIGLVWLLTQRAKDRRQVPPRQRPGLTTPKVLLLFGSLMLLIGVGLMGWDHWRLVKALKNGEARVVEGPVQSWGTERQRTADLKRHDYYTCERFYVGDSIWFSYRWEVGQAGFHNAASPRIAFHDGMPVRAAYLYADGADEPPRIVRLEIADPTTP